MVVVAHNLRTSGVKTGGSLGLAGRKPSLLGKFQAGVRACLSKQGGWPLRNSRHQRLLSDLCMNSHIHTHMCMETTIHIQKPTHTHTLDSQVLYIKLYGIYTESPVYRNPLQLTYDSRYSIGIIQMAVSLQFKEQ